MKLAHETLAFIDIETTGGTPETARIIEVAILIVRNDRIVKRYSTLVNPQTYIPNTVQNITGISAEAVLHAPVFAAVSSTIFTMLQGAVLVAHNVQFDFACLRAEFLRCNIDFTAYTLCTVHVSRTLYPQEIKHSLDAIADRFSFTIENRHRAMGDALCMYTFYMAAKQDVGNVLFMKTVEALLQRSLLPLSISLSSIQALPTCYGVCTYYDSQNTVLAIEAYSNMQHGVLKFVQNNSLPTEKEALRSQVKSVDFIETGGIISALYMKHILATTCGLQVEVPYVCTYTSIAPNIIRVHPIVASQSNCTLPIAVFRTFAKAVSALQAIPGCIVTTLQDEIQVQLPDAIDASDWHASVTAMWNVWPYSGPVHICEHASAGTVYAQYCHNWVHYGFQPEIGSLPAGVFNFELYQEIKRTLKKQQFIPHCSIVPVEGV